MSFPDPSLVAPSLATHQMSYAGVTFGGIDRTQTYQLQSLSGLDPPDYLSADEKRALDQGELAGVDLSPGRDIVIQQLAQASTLAALEAARQALGAAFNPQGTVEQPLYLQLASGLFACMARPRRHHFPLDVNTFVAKAVVVTTQLHATDPRWYAAPTKSANVGPPSPLGGLTFPVTFPASFGGGSAGSVLQVYNNGKMEMRPVLVITGPCVNPIVQNISVAGAPSLGFNVTLNAGDTLTVDTDLESVILRSAGTSVGVGRRDTEMVGNVWWNLPPGLSQLQWICSSTSVGSSLTVQSADAWMTL